MTPTDGSSTDILAVANSPVLWFCTIGVFVVIIVQSIVYMRAVRKAAPGVGLSPADRTMAFRSGAISAIGPSLAVCLVAIALLALFGTPAVLVRIGLIGSAAYEVSAAGISAGTVGAKLGTPSYTQSVFALAYLTMSMGGAMWMITTLIVTPILRRGDQKLRTLNPVVMTVIPAAALIGAFAALTLTEVPKSPVHAAAAFASAAVMAVCLTLAAVLRQRWLREWGLGFSILAGLAVAYLMHAPQA